MGGKSDVFSSPHKFHTAGHILRDFPENYESFRNGVSPERRSSTSSEADSIISDKPVRNLSRSFESHSSPQGLIHSTTPTNTKQYSHEKSNNSSSKRNSSNITITDQVLQQNHHKQRLNSSSNDSSSKGQHAKDSLSNNNGSTKKCPEGQVQGKDGKLWPAWVYCTRYSDRPSSGKN